MNIVIEKLTKYDIDLKNTLDRFCGDEDLYVTCLQMFIDDENIEALKVALQEKNIKKGFEAAHALKGVVGNLGLTFIYQDVVVIVESLRKGECGDELLPLYDKVLVNIAKVKKILN